MIVLHFPYRNILIGALLAAEAGSSDVIPEEWKSKFSNYATIESLTDSIVAGL